MSEVHWVFSCVNNNNSYCSGTKSYHSEQEVLRLKAVFWAMERNRQELLSFGASSGSEAIPKNCFLENASIHSPFTDSKNIGLESCVSRLLFNNEDNKY